MSIIVIITEPGALQHCYEDLQIFRAVGKPPLAFLEEWTADQRDYLLLFWRLIYTKHISLLIFVLHSLNRCRPFTYLLLKADLYTYLCSILIHSPRYNIRDEQSFVVDTTFVNAFMAK